MNYIPIEELEVYKLAMEIGEEIWVVVDKWPEFPKKVVGAQFCEAGDSIAANISEAHGRYHYKDKKNFCFFARGSLLESKTWLKKSHNRKLVDDETHTRIHDKLKRCHYLLNQYIKSIGTSNDGDSKVQEPDALPYGLPPDFDNLNDF
ncbi:MAG: four helix bundle protein [Saprospiraceae bacterium]|nr:four helix bundle protein [Saprospiraceae bacterium]